MSFPLFKSLSGFSLPPALPTVTLIFLIRSEYKPGKPGGAWTQEELLIVRGKLWKMYANNGAVMKWWEDGKITNPGLHALNTKRENSDEKEYKEEEELGFLPAKVLRLR